jgi:hypothetical protein
VTSCRSGVPSREVLEQIDVRGLLGDVDLLLGLLPGTVDGYAVEVVQTAELKKK